MLHTFVPKPLQNKDYGVKLVKETLDYARENHLKVIITCPFAHVYVARHKEYEDIL
ncbi:GNAT family N-acetyltransferase [Butyricimonas paravirosa]